MKKNNVILEKSYTFALRIVKLSQFLVAEKKEFIISRQILKSGTSTGVNAEEVVGGQSEKDFYANLLLRIKKHVKQSIDFDFYRILKFLKRNYLNHFSKILMKI